jgi:hypothetical protein
MSPSYGRYMDGRTVEVAPERLAGWVERFAQRHGEPTVDVHRDSVSIFADDGARAAFPVAWGGLPARASLDLAAVVEHLSAPRRVGVLLARRSAHAVGLFAGANLVASKVDTHYVQGRTKAGGWSQQRYARRRANQADQAATSAAADLRRVVWDARREWDWFVTGGEAAAVRTVLAHMPELAALAPVRVLPTPDPRLAVLRSFPELYRAIPITLNNLA